MFILADGNTTNEIDENIECLHMHSTHGNGAEQLSGYLFLVVT
jgi:hypothetical protein